MKRCEVCGNEYDKPIEVKKDETTHVFDSFECAIHALAPRCYRCGCTILGHGVETGEAIFCSAHCAGQTGETKLRDRV